MLTDLHGRTAVLTGAGSGFGLACARLGAAQGMNLVLVDVQADALARAEAELSAAGAQVMARRVDVANAQEMEALAAEVQQRFGAPHFVFNNAGVGSGGLIWENSVADWQWVLGVNVWGVIHGVRCFTPMMLEAARHDPTWRGHIVNTASMAGVLCPPNMGVYNVSKHAVVALSETLWHDLRLVTDQVGASVLCPFFVSTGIHESHRNRPADLAAAKPTTSQQLGQAMIGKAVSAGKVSAEQVAQKVFDAMAAEQFYIYTHPDDLGSLRERVDALASGAAEPAQPYRANPALVDQMRAALREP